MDERIITKIHQLVNESVRDVREMQRHIKIYIKNELFCSSPLPPPTSRRYNPKKKDVRNHMYRAAVELKFSKLDQENLELKVKEWQKESPSDNFFFRGYGSINEDELDADKMLPSEEESEEVIVSAIYFILLHQLVKQKVKKVSKTME